MNGSDAMNKPTVGTGSPMNELVWRVSMLNFARRTAAKAAKTNANIGKMLMFMNIQLMPVCPSNHATINDGATPNETTSDNESSSPPIGDFAFKALAANPSKKSKTAARNIIAEAIKI